MYLHTLEGEQASKESREEEAPLCLVDSLHCQFYLDEAVAEAAEWGTAVGSGTQGMKEQSLYHSHTNRVVIGRHTN